MTPSDLSGTLPAALDTSKPNVARAYDYLLGGKGSYAADREAVWQILWTWPEVRDMARANRAFMQRAVRFLAGEGGYGSSSTSARASPQPGRCMRWPDRSRRVPEWCKWTTIRSCTCTSARC
jgi:hypothetical protein